MDVAKQKHMQQKGRNITVDNKINQESRCAMHPTSSQGEGETQVLHRRTLLHGVSVDYILEKEDEHTREEFGSACDAIYTLKIRLHGPAGEEECVLPDVARTSEQAEDMLFAFANGGVTPVCAAEVAEEWLATH